MGSLLPTSPDIGNLTTIQIPEVWNKDWFAHFLQLWLAQGDFHSAIGSITTSQLAPIAAHTVLGNSTGATAPVLALTTTQLTSLINPFSNTLSGAAPASGGGTTTFLRADGTWTTPGGGGTVTSIGIGTGLASTQSPLTASGTMSLALRAANSIMGNNTGGTSTPIDLTATQVTAFLNPFTNVLQGVVPASGGGTSNFLRADGTWISPSAASPGNPTAYVGLTPVNGSAGTYMRSDAAPPLDVTISPTWTGIHTWSGNTLLQTIAGRLTIGPPSSGATLTVNTVSGANAVYSSDGTNVLNIRPNASFAVINSSNGLQFNTNNTQSLYISTVGGLYTTGATGGDKGSGTINATGLYINGTAVTVSGIAQRISDVTVGALRITNPGGASFTNAGNPVTGAIKIKLPTASFKSSTMIRFTIKIYEYNGNTAGTSREINVGGYNYSSPLWYNIFATQVSMNAGDINVRFGRDGTSECIWIGETASSWFYPKVEVTDFMAGHANYTDAMWGTGWAISTVGSFDSVDYTIIAAQPLNSQNFGSYSPTLTGTGASGTWNITASNATNATTATTATNWGTYGAVPAPGTSAHTANTIPRSDTNGYLYTGYINAQTNNNENPVISQIIVTNGDNYYRKCSLYNFGLQFLEAVDPGSSVVAIGYCYLFQGLLVQWGKTGSIVQNGSYTVTFPIAFPNACFVVLNSQELASTANSYGVSHGTPSKTQVVIYNNGAIGAPQTWIAFGN